MEALKIYIMLSVGIGCLLGILRFVLDDKWNLLPKALCRFCAFFWIAFVLFGLSTIYFILHDYSLRSIAVGFISSVAIATVTTNISYVYIKNAN